MNRNHRLHRLYNILFVILAIFFQNIVFAGLGVDPVILEIVVSKNSENKGSFKVLNTSMNPVNIRVEPQELQEAVDFKIKDWLTLDPLEMKLEPNEQKEVSYKIIPPVESRGELRCMVFFIADEIGERRSNIGIRFGVPIYAIIDMTIEFEVSISDIQIGYAENILSGKVYINNKSNVHIRPDVQINIFDSKDKLVKSFTLPYGQPAQVGQNRVFMFQQNIVLSEGKYKLVAKVDYGKLYCLNNRVVEKKAAFVVKIPKGETDRMKDENTKK